VLSGSEAESTFEDKDATKILSFFRLEVEIRTINISGQAADIDTGVSVWSVGWSVG
jgi:hypothetical protein